MRRSKGVMDLDERYGRTERWCGVPVTYRQYQYLEAINSLWRKNLRSPTLQEIADEVGVVSRAAAFNMVSLLKRKRLVSYDGRNKTTRTLNGTLFTLGFDVMVSNGVCFMKWRLDE